MQGSSLYTICAATDCCVYVIFLVGSLIIESETVIHTVPFWVLKNWRWMCEIQNERCYKLRQYDVYPTVGHELLRKKRLLPIWQLALIWPLRSSAALQYMSCPYYGTTISLASCLLFVTMGGVLDWLISLSWAILLNLLRLFECDASLSRSSGSSSTYELILSVIKRGPHIPVDHCQTYI